MTLNHQEMDQKSNCAAARMVKLPIVSSAWSRLSVLYIDTKGSHPNLKVVCDAFEDRAVFLRTMASNTFSPLMMKLEPQISIANGIASKSFDWLTSTFPFLLGTTEEVVAIAKNKKLEAQEVGSVLDISTGCVQHAVEHSMDSLSNPVIERALTMAEAGLDQALSISEALVDCMLPPAEDENEEVSSVQGFESTTQKTYPERLLSISTKLCRRTYKAIEKLSTTPRLPQKLQTHLPAFIYSLPQSFQHQALTLILFISQMYTLGCPSLPQQSSTEGTGWSSPHKDFLKMQWQQSPTWQTRLPKATDCGCKCCEAYNDATSCTSP